jgi:hypothetical protein
MFMRTFFEIAVPPKGIPEDVLLQISFLDADLGPFGGVHDRGQLRVTVSSCHEMYSDFWEMAPLF